MPRLFELRKMPQGDYRMILVDDGDGSPRRTFKGILGDEFYDSTIVVTQSLMRPDATPIKFMVDVVRQNPGSYWDEPAPRVWIWKRRK